MKKLTLTAFLILVSPLYAHAQSYYDYRTGSSYNTVGNTTYGHNYRTGNSWSVTNTPTGSYGRDARGDSWNYNNSTGYYSNSRGVNCYGYGVNRQCY